LEQFSQGRSVVWYWRQVFIAILVCLSRKFRVLWTALAFTVLWFFVLSHFLEQFLATAPNARAVYGWGITGSWPLPLIFTIGFFTGIGALPLVVALNVYLGLTRGFSLRGFSRGLFVGLFSLAFGLVLFVGAAMLLLLLVFDLSDLQQAFWMVLSRSGFVVYTMASLALFFALLVSMLAAQSDNTLAINAGSNHD
jgi:hypothetical protein